MLILLSPAKSMDYKSPLLTQEFTQPRLMDHSKELIAGLQKLSQEEIAKLMSISDKLAQLNHDRFSAWESQCTVNNSRQAILAFTGDVYQGLELAKWTADDFTKAQKQLRILSGLYGFLRPLDLMQPYRLEMGTRYGNERGKNLYEFWGQEITKLVNLDLEQSGSDAVVNLASNEYFSSVKTNELKGQLITPIFKDEKNGKYKIISFYAKKARGMRADFVVRQGILDPDKLKKFKTAGYQFSKQDSTDKEFVFTRAENVKA